jgi:hypothetical protein
MIPGERGVRRLQSIIDYAMHQGLIPRQIEVDELFDETTRTLES